VVQVDAWQQTTAQGIYAAGEVTGISGVDAAVREGQIAGSAATGRHVEARRFFSARERDRHFAAALERSFALRAELRTLAKRDTIVCRCEDVPFEALQGQASWREAKLHMRCGMGPCQGRVCGPATQFLFGWTPGSVRPPVTVARVASLVRPGNDEQQTQEQML
jgi:NADPH-dependent 2,4-dienoyl-CoA reductase/sulfur reductase-like enzyme